MKMPGFNAEASLYKTGECYFMVEARILKMHLLPQFDFIGVHEHWFQCLYDYERCLSLCRHPWDDSCHRYCRSFYNKCFGSDKRSTSLFG